MVKEYLQRNCHTSGIYYIGLRRNKAKAVPNIGRKEFSIRFEVQGIMNSFEGCTLSTSREQRAARQKYITRN
jgi:hypothetical protein